MKNIKPGNPLPCISCGAISIPSARLDAGGIWMELQAASSPFGGCCSQECVDSLFVESAMEAMGPETVSSIPLNVAHPRYGVVRPDGSVTVRSATDPKLDQWLARHFHPLWSANQP